MATLPMMHPPHMLPQLSQAHPQMAPMDLPVQQPVSPMLSQQQPQIQQPADPFHDVEQSATLLKGSVDDDALSSFIDQAALGGDINQLANKAVSQSFNKGVSDLTKLLGNYAPSGLSQQMSEARSALQSFMKTNNNSQQQLDTYRKAIQPLASINQQLRNISSRPEQSRFLRTMQASKDQVINQMINDISQADPNGQVHLEYLITGKAPKGVPQVLLDNQSNILWQKIITTIANGITNQIEALLQRDISGTMRTQSMSNGVANAHQTVMQTMQPMQQKITQIQQVHAPVFKTSDTIRPTENKPIQRIALNHYIKP